MDSLTKTLRSPGGRIASHVLLLLAATLLAGTSCAHAPDSADETGIKGTVLIGPIRPGPAIAGQSNEAPIRALFHVLDIEGKLLTRFESDEHGYFTVPVPPGDYTIVPDSSAPIAHPKRQRKKVTVPEDGFAEVILRFDTGMR